MRKVIYIVMLMGFFVGKINAQNSVVRENGKSPLYILDGLITTPAITAKIDSSNVKGIWVIKSRSEQEKYGYAGRNGVVIISTKSSKLSKIDTSANNYPLILVDSVEVYSEDMKKISPDVVDNVQVIKDAKARDMYGFKGARGVVIVTTKSNKKAKK